VRGREGEQERASRPWQAHCKGHADGARVCFSVKKPKNGVPHTRIKKCCCAFCFHHRHRACTACLVTTLEATQGQIISQFPTDATFEK